jgi:hypothetical protein
MVPDAKGFQLVMIRFKPVYAREYKGQLALEINHSSDNCLKIHTIGYGSTPKLALPLNANVCIKPTCLGVTSTRVYTVQCVTNWDLSSARDVLCPGVSDRAFRLFVLPCFAAMRPAFHSAAVFGSLQSSQSN